MTNAVGLEYRCRRCGEKYEADPNYWDEETHANAVMWAMVGHDHDLAWWNKRGEETRLGCLTEQSGTSIHECPDGGKGMADFIGLTPPEEEEEGEDEATVEIPA